MWPRGTAGYGKKPVTRMVLVPELDRLLVLCNETITSHALADLAVKGILTKARLAGPPPSPLATRESRRARPRLRLPYAALISRQPHLAGRRARRGFPSRKLARAAALGEAQAAARGACLRSGLRLRLRLRLRRACVPPHSQAKGASDFCVGQCGADWSAARLRFIGDRGLMPHAHTWAHARCAEHAVGSGSAKIRVVDAGLARRAPGILL